MSKAIDCPNCGTQITISDPVITEQIVEQKESEITSLENEEKTLELQNANEIANLQASYESQIKELQEDLDATNKQLADVQSQLQIALSKAQP